MILQSRFILKPCATVWTGKGSYFLMDGDLVSVQTAHFEECFVTLFTLVPLLLVMHLPDVSLQSVELRKAFTTLITLLHAQSCCCLTFVCVTLWFRPWQYFPLEKERLKNERTSKISSPKHQIRKMYLDDLGFGRYLDNLVAKT